MLTRRLRSFESAAHEFLMALLALIGGCWMAGRIFLPRLAAVDAAIERIMAGEPNSDCR